MQKQDLIEAVAKDSDISKAAAKRAVDSVFDTIGSALTQGDKVSILGFGTFEVRDRGERQGRNPQTGATITIPASKAPAFKPGKGLKEQINK